MKRTISLALSAIILLSLFACGTPAAVPNPPLILGEKYLTDLDYEQALLQFDQAIAIEPKNPRGYLGKTDALLHLERQNEAVQVLGAAVKQCRPQRAALNEAKTEVATSLVDGYIGLSSAYDKLGWREIAVLLLRRVCKELPEESRLREALERLHGSQSGLTDETPAEGVFTEETLRLMGVAFGLSAEEAAHGLGVYLLQKEDVILHERSENGSYSYSYRDSELGRLPYVQGRELFDYTNSQGSNTRWQVQYGVYNAVESTYERWPKDAIFLGLRYGMPLDAVKSKFYFDQSPKATEATETGTVTLLYIFSDNDMEYQANETVDADSVQLYYSIESATEKIAIDFAFEEGKLVQVILRSQDSW